ncbi:hypothetical protein [Sphingobium sp.]|uniref:hypothetical protein n=1 Tax=Sphingobium sp. TaxID=1912891 RepID=UPI00261C8C81|nr:hypothetical protein [Sphingobium sp.]
MHKCIIRIGVTTALIEIQPRIIQPLLEPILKMKLLVLAADRLNQFAIVDGLDQLFEYAEAKELFGVGHTGRLLSSFEREFHMFRLIAHQGRAPPHPRAQISARWKPGVAPDFETHDSLDRQPCAGCRFIEQ